MNYRMITTFLVTFIVWLVVYSTTFAQTTAFTYQGKLTDNDGIALTGHYDFQFKLFDTSDVNSQTPPLGTVLSKDVTVTSGTFTVQLDFGNCATCFNGGTRWLEINLRPLGSSTFTRLTPRQSIASNPYSIRSLNTATADALSGACANCVTVSQIGSVAGSAVLGPIPVTSVPAGSANYIQNGLSPQPSSSFNVSGDGIIGGSVAIGTPSPAQKLDVVSGTAEMLFGAPSGADGIELQSSQVGHAPALWLTHNGTGGRKFRIASFSDGTNATSGSFVIRDDTPGLNSGVDRFKIDNQGSISILYDGFISPTASLAIRSRIDALTTSIASGMSAEVNGRLINFGVNTGREGTFDSSKSGYWMRADTRGGAEGIRFFGKSVNSGLETELMTIDGSNGYVGIGNPAPSSNFQITGTGIVRALIDSTNSAGWSVGFNGQKKWTIATNSVGQFQIVNETNSSNALWIDSATNSVGVGTNTPNDRLEVNGTIRVATLGLAGSTTLCRNGSNQISTCSSSLRYKTNINRFTSGLNLLNQLSPITFSWKQGGAKDLGLGAEDVAKVEPLLVTYNDKGEVEGVKYDRIGVVLINAVKEQQVQIDQQKHEIEVLKKLVCSMNAAAEVCKAKQ